MDTGITFPITVNIRLMKALKTFLLISVIAWLLTPAPGGSLTRQGDVIVNLSKFDAKGKPNHGIYSINTKSGNISPLISLKNQNLVSIRMSPDARYILGTSFDRKKFTRDLNLLDLNRGKSYKLTFSPSAGVTRSGKPIGTFEKYGFSPDGRWAVITFPDGIELKPVLNSSPLICQVMQPNESSIILIDIRRWLERQKADAIMKIPGDDFPSFSPSGKKFLVPGKMLKSGRKILLYEIEKDDDTAIPAFRTWQLPFNNASQGAFASEKKLFLLDGDDLITYDISSKKIELKQSLSNYYLASMGCAPPHTPCTPDFSEGPISFGGQYFAFLMPSGYSVIERTPEPDTEISIPNLFRQNLMLVYGDTESPWFQRMEIPPLPDKAYGQNFLYHKLFILPERNGKQAVLFTSGWNYSAFRIIDLANREISEPIEGFFMGMNSNGTGLIYTQCGPSNDCYKSNDFNWNTSGGGGKEVYVTMNLLKYRDLKTDLDYILFDQPSYTSEAFFVK